MKHLERIIYWNKDLMKGIGFTFVIENNQIISKHIDYLTEEDWR